MSKLYAIKNFLRSFTCYQIRIKLVPALLFVFALFVGNAYARSVSPLPANLADMTKFKANIGSSYYFYITGSTEGALWGTDIYTSDSSVATAAVHQGLLQAGETGIIKVTVLAGQDSYNESTANGVYSHPYGKWDSSFSVAADDGGDNPILEAPENLSSYKSVIGGVYLFTVTGAKDENIWGSNVYSADSHLAGVVVHAGLLQTGETGVVRVVMGPGLPAYISTTNNGITSKSWGEYEASYSVSDISGKQPLIAYPGSPEHPLTTTNLKNYEKNIGGSFYFTVTGEDTGSVWGSSYYTSDSTLAKAAVHAGVVNLGETKVVKVTIEPGQDSYVGSIANGIETLDWGSYSGSYRISGADNDLGTIPVISSSLTQNLAIGEQFSYQIQASHQPTYYQATGLPESFSVSSSGMLTGSGKISGTFLVELLVSNESGTSTRTLILTIGETNNNNGSNANGANTGGSNNNESDTGSANPQSSTPTAETATISENLDIYYPSLTLDTPAGSFNIWIKLGYIGNLTWVLTGGGINQTIPAYAAGTVAQNLDITMPSVNYQTALLSLNLSIYLTFDKVDANGNYLWKLQNYTIH